MNTEKLHSRDLKSQLESSRKALEEKEDTLKRCKTKQSKGEDHQIVVENKKVGMPLKYFREQDTPCTPLYRPSLPNGKEQEKCGEVSLFIIYFLVWCTYVCTFSVCMLYICILFVLLSTHLLNQLCKPAVLL